MKSPRNQKLNNKELRELLKIEVFELSKLGYSSRKIAAAIKIKHGVDIDHVTVLNYRKEALAELREERMEVADEYRTMQLERYHDLLAAVLPGAAKEGKPDLSKLDRALAIMSAINKLEGLDKPAKSHVTLESVDKLLSALPEEAAAEIVRLMEDGADG